MVSNTSNMGQISFQLYHNLESQTLCCWEPCSCVVVHVVASYLHFTPSVQMKRTNKYPGGMERTLVLLWIEVYLRFYFWHCHDFKHNVHTYLGGSPTEIPGSFTYEDTCLRITIKLQGYDIKGHTGELSCVLLWLLFFLAPKDYDVWMNSNQSSYIKQEHTELISKHTER